MMLVKVEINDVRRNSIAVCTSHRHKFNSKMPIALVNSKSIYHLQFYDNIAENIVQIGILTKFAIFQMETPSNLTIESYELKSRQASLKQVSFELNLQKKPPQNLELTTSQLESLLRRENLLLNNQTNFTMNIKDIIVQFRPKLPSGITFGTIDDDTILEFKRSPHARINIVDDTQNIDQLFQNFESKVKGLKVGGMQKQLQLIDRRVFGTRMLHPRMMRNMGLKHIKGMLLYGPPGTGKTLIARQISKVLKVQPKIVNGPQIFNEFVGKSEEKIRQLFADAVKQQEQKGAKSQLHCIIFDEIDAICKKRGTQTSSAVYDQIVNQLLTCIDGVNVLNNILVIGITNRKDLIDQAVLRPGRLQVHIEVNIPDQQGRLQVLQIHTELMNKNGLLSDVNLQEIAKQTKNYTGAQLEGVVKSAQSFALEKWKKLPPNMQTKDNTKVTQEDFLHGIQEVHPQFGKDNKILESIVPKQHIRIDKYEKVYMNLNKAIGNLEDGKHTFLIRGNNGVGKSVLAARCALTNDSSFIKLINSDRFLGMNQSQIMNEIVRIFDDAQKCLSSFIVLDDILRLIDFVPLGPRYSSNILNLLINLIKKVASPLKKQIIIATASSAKEFEDLGLLKYFQHQYSLEKLSQDQIFNLLQIMKVPTVNANKLMREFHNSTIQEIVSTMKINCSWNSSKPDFTFL